MSEDALRLEKRIPRAHSDGGLSAPDPGYRMLNVTSSLSVESSTLLYVQIS